MSRSALTRAKILAAARDIFARDGFDKASTRAIATSAGVNPALIFRYFGSKSGLYDEAVLKPLRGFVEQFVENWAKYEREPHDATKTATEYLGGLYDLFREHKDLVRALIGSGAQGTRLDGEAEPVAESIVALLDRVEVVIDTEAARRGWSGFDTRMSIRMAFGMAFSLAVLNDWMFPDSELRPKRDEIVDEMVSFVLRSMSNPGLAPRLETPSPGL